MARATNERLDWGTHARDELARHGHRAGGARERVLQLLEDQDCYLSAHEIYNRLRDNQVTTPGLASVYRALEVLSSLGLVHRTEVDGTAFYEPVDPGGDHHHHAICDLCGRRDAFSDESLERAIERLGDRLDYRLDTHDIVLRGLCPDCTKKR